MADMRGQIRKWLEGLGPTSATVAESLRQIGIRGRQNSIDHCALARALETQGCRDVRVYDSAYWSWAQWCDEQDRSYELALPPWVRQFVRDFDAGKYPDLEEA